MNKKALTTKEIAKMLNISISTVSRALHNSHKISPATTQRVREVALELGYEPNQTAVFLQSGKTFTLGVIIPDLSDPFYAEALNGIEDYCIQNDYNVLLGQSHEDTEREKKILLAMKNHRVDGLLVAIARSSAHADHFDLLKKYDIPLVFFDRIPSGKEVNTVSCKLDAAITEAAAYLAKEGHRRIVFINSSPHFAGTSERENAFGNALRSLQLEFSPAQVLHSDLSPESTYGAMQQLSETLPDVTAVITFNEVVALDAMHYLKTTGNRPDRMLSFVSLGSSPLWRYLDHPPLASIEQFPYEQGQRATEMLLDILQIPRSVRPNGTCKKIFLEPRLLIHPR